MLAAHVVAQTADVAGTWTLTMAPTQGGAAPPTVTTVTLTLTQDGSKITGKISAQGGSFQTEGTVSGDDATWTVTHKNSDGKTITITYKAVVSGDSMKGALIGPSAGMSRDFTGKRGGK
jgi:hypothetical protein